MFGIDDAAAVAGGVGLLNFIGAQSTNEANRDIAAANNQWSAQQYATRYQTQVKDLQAAGLNPALAYGASPGQAPTAQQVQFQNPVASAVSAANETYSTRGKFQHDVSSAQKADEEIGLIHANNAKITAETENIADEGRRIRATVWLLKEQADLVFQKLHSEIKARELMEAQIRQLKSNTKLLDFDASAAEDLVNLGRRSQQLKPIVDMIRGIIRK